MRKKSISMLKNVLALFLGSVLALAMMEGIFRVYQPFEFRVKANKIVLPAHKEYIIPSDKSDKLDNLIVHRKNSLGFRGAEKPADFEKSLSVIAIGGSATECFYLSDDKTWPHLLGEKLKKKFNPFWINNAGLDGHSTFGHIALLENHVFKIKPKVVLFLVGSIDIQRENPNPFDDRTALGKLSRHSVKGWLVSAANQSEVFALAINVFRYYKGRNMRRPNPIDFKNRRTLEMSPEIRAQTLILDNQRYLLPYENRLRRLILLCRQNDIEPILVTHPMLFGDVIDDVTRVDLGRIDVSQILREIGAAPKGSTNGLFQWEQLEMYNDVTRRVGKKEKIHLVDLARELPKSTRYYYDSMHYGNEGAAKVAEILYDRLAPYLAKKYPGHYHPERRSSDEE